MLVPVISTTFASVSRLFGPLGRGGARLALVDEAGQATPQNTIGALWRSQRAVIVGDPLQLEPITTIPFEAEQAIRTHYGVGEEWLTGRGSVQSLADRLNRFGTALPGADGRRWVGAPLAVHRRCDRPMFDISNEIAYDGLMIEATDPTLARAFAAAIRRFHKASGLTFARRSRMATGFPPRATRSTGSSLTSARSNSISRRRWRSRRSETSPNRSENAPMPMRD